MRSSKSRSRSKSNRQRSPMGNIVNRVFDSSGPEGKVRGTPQQIIDKYLTLARDAQLSNDRVAAENFLQHAEHYARMLSEAQREMDARQQNGGGQQHQNGDRQDGDDRRDDRSERGGDDTRNDRRDDRREDRTDERRERTAESATDVLDVIGDDDAGGLVETPETRATAPEVNGGEEKRPSRNRRSRRPRDEAAAPAEGDAPAPTEAPEIAP